MWNPMVRCRGSQTQTFRISWKRGTGLLSRWTGKSGRRFSSSTSTMYLCRWVWHQKIGGSQIFGISCQIKCSLFSIVFLWNRPEADCRPNLKPRTIKMPATFKKWHYRATSTGSTGKAYVQVKPIYVLWSCDLLMIQMVKVSVSLYEWYEVCVVRREILQIDHNY